jgi:hypothetical protein
MSRPVEAHKTRSLKKYEAAEIAQSRDSANPPLDFLSPFGPMIGKSAIADALVELINRHCDGVFHQGAGGELLLPPELVLGQGGDPLGSLIAHLIRRYVLGVDGVAPGRITIDAVWVVSQYANSPSPVHFHSGDVSGVLYLRTPHIEEESKEEQKTYISGRHAGHLNFLIGGKQRFSKSLISFKPRVGDFYIFPGWLLHGAEPFRGSGERRSLAFNAFVEGGDA